MEITICIDGAFLHLWLKSSEPKNERKFRSVKSLRYKNVAVPHYF